MDSGGANLVWTLKSQNNGEVFMYEYNIIIWMWVDYLASLLSLWKKSKNAYPRMIYYVITVTKKRTKKL